MQDPKLSPTIPSDYASDEEMIEIIEAFVAEMPGRLESLVQAMDEGELGVVRRVAHQLRGAGAGYGYPTVSEAAGELERALARSREAHDGLEDVREQVSHLIDLCGRIVVR